MLRAPGPDATLGRWLAFQRGLHPAAIDLGLDRTREVAARAGLERLPFPVVTVAGTNGKGSCAVMIEAVLRAAGLRTGVYLSPHLLRYNERVRIAGHDARDAALVAASAAIERVRGSTPLTFFEFGTLAAVRALVDAGVDCAVLEVGLGGRLDAVNTFDADVAVLTSIAVDHSDWLGTTRDAIAREKAGVMRRDRPAICADPDPPATLLAVARETGADLRLFGDRFGAAVRDEERWDWWDGQIVRRGIELPALRGDCQIANAAAALAAVTALPGVELPEVEAIGAALARLRLRGRLEVHDDAVERVFDVAHNPAAAHALARWLGSNPRRGRTRAVCAMLADKDARGLVAALAPAVDEWWWGGIAGDRGRAWRDLERASGIERTVVAGGFRSVGAAWRAALAASRDGDRMLAVGSFRTVRAALAADRRARAAHG